MTVDAGAGGRAGGRAGAGGRATPAGAGAGGRAGGRAGAGGRATPAGAGAGAGAGGRATPHPPMARHVHQYRIGTENFEFSGAGAACVAPVVQSIPGRVRT